LRFKEWEGYELINQYRECEIHFTFFEGVIYPSKKERFYKRSFRETYFDFNRTTSSCYFSSHLSPIFLFFSVLRFW